MTVSTRSAADSGTPNATSDSPSDAELLAATRTGDADAYGTLFRRHMAAARALARQLTRSGPDVDDLVAEAFAKVLAALRNGNGPTVALRPYLLTAVRRVHIDRATAGQRVQPVEDIQELDTGQPFVDPALAGLERSLVAEAYSRLPDRWQSVLWHTEVEGMSPRELAPLLGMSPNAVSALALRARAGLREAYLEAHVPEAKRPGCEPVVPRLAAYARGATSSREGVRINKHVDGCNDCRLVLADLRDVGVALRAVAAPLVLGLSAAGTALTAGSGAAAGAGTVTAGTGIVSSLGAATSTLAAGGWALASAAALAVGTVAVGAEGYGGGAPPPPVAEVLVESAAPEPERDAERVVAVPVRAATPVDIGVEWAMEASTATDEWPSEVGVETGPAWGVGQFPEPSETASDGQEALPVGEPESVTNELPEDEPGQVEPDHAKPEQAQPEQAQPEQVKPEQAEPEHVEPGQVEPGQAQLEQVEQNGQFRDDTPACLAGSDHSVPRPAPAEAEAEQ